MAVDPVLVGGEDRSGTTLVGLILDAHPQLTVGPELDFLLPPSLGHHVVACCDLEERGDPRVSGRGVAAADPSLRAGIQFVRQCHRFGLAPPELRELAEATCATLGRDLVSFEDRCALIEQVGEICRLRAGAAGWGMKIQRLIARPRRFAAVWPAARFVHVVRDGRDVAASHLRGGRNWGYREIDAAARGWAEVVGSAELRAAPRVHTVRYERLVSDPRAELEPLLAALELPWEDAVMAHETVHHALLRHPYDHPSAAEAARPIRAEAVGRYLRDLTAAEIAAFEAVAGPVLTRWGYRLSVSAEG